VTGVCARTAVDCRQRARPQWTASHSRHPQWIPQSHRCCGRTPQHQHPQTPHPTCNRTQSIIRSYRQAATIAVQKVKDLSVSLEGKSEAEKRELLTKCASTSLNSKLVSGEKEFFSEMVVTAVSVLDPATLDLKMIGMKKVIGGGLRDSFLVDGVAFKKTFSYAGFEQQPKSFKGARPPPRGLGRRGRWFWFGLVWFGGVPARSPIWNPCPISTSHPDPPTPQTPRSCCSTLSWS